MQHGTIPGDGRGIFIRVLRGIGIGPYSFINFHEVASYITSVTVRITFALYEWNDAAEEWKAFGKDYKEFLRSLEKRLGIYEGAQ